MEMGSCDVGDSFVSLHNGKLCSVRNPTQVGCGVKRVMHMRAGFGEK